MCDEHTPLLTEAGDPTPEFIEQLDKLHARLTALLLKEPIHCVGPVLVRLLREYAEERSGFNLEETIDLLLSSIGSAIHEVVEDQITSVEDRVASVVNTSDN